MNNSHSPGVEDRKTLQILNELSDNGLMTQRDLSSSLGIALGLVNSYIKNLIKKGCITVKNIPPRRYAYYLTPRGFSEKTRLTYYLLQDYTRVYREARGTLKKLFGELRASGVQRVVFAGADEIAEIAYLTLQETGLELSGIADEEKAGEKFFGRDIVSIQDVGSINHDSIVVTSYLKREHIFNELVKHKVDRKDIKTIFPV